VRVDGGTSSSNHPRMGGRRAGCEARGRIASSAKRVGSGDTNSAGYADFAAQPDQIWRRANQVIRLKGGSGRGDGIDAGPGCGRVWTPVAHPPAGGRKYRIAIQRIGATASPGGPRRRVDRRAPDSIADCLINQTVLRGGGASREREPVAGWRSGKRWASGRLTRRVPTDHRRTCPSLGPQGGR
jgi:hypothetical protein